MYFLVNRLELLIIQFQAQDFPTIVHLTDPVLPVLLYKHRSHSVAEWCRQSVEGLLSTGLPRLVMYIYVALRDHGFIKF